MPLSRDRDLGLLVTLNTECVQGLREVVAPDGDALHVRCADRDISSTAASAPLAH